MNAEKQKVLLIDDEMSILVTFRIALMAAGYDVVTCQSANDGLRLAVKEDFSFVVVDHRMPDISGAELIKELREFECRTPVLLMSASDSPIEGELKQTLAPIRFEAKPLTPSRLRAALSELDAEAMV